MPCNSQDKVIFCFRRCHSWTAAAVVLALQRSTKDTCNVFIQPLTWSGWYAADGTTAQVPIHARLMDSCIHRECWSPPLSMSAAVTSLPSKAVLQNGFCNEMGIRPVLS